MLNERILTIPANPRADHIGHTVFVSVVDVETGCILQELRVTYWARQKCDIYVSTEENVDLSQINVHDYVKARKAGHEKGNEDLDLIDEQTQWLVNYTRAKNVHKRWFDCTGVIEWGKIVGLYSHKGIVKMIDVINTQAFESMMWVGEGNCDITVINKIHTGHGYSTYLIGVQSVELEGCHLKFHCKQDHHDSTYIIPINTVHKIECRRRD